MKEVEHRFDVAASSEDILAFLLDHTFADRLQDKLERVTSVEIRSLDNIDDHLMRRVCRFTAPTRLPRPLRRFQDKAPDEVSWDEIWTVNTAENHIDTEIVADAPDHWHDYYENHGKISLIESAPNKTEIHRTVSFSLNAPTGMGMFLNRAVKSELDTILDAEAQVLKERFQQ